MFTQSCSWTFGIWKNLTHRHFFEDKPLSIDTHTPRIQWYSNWYFWLPIIELSSSVEVLRCFKKYSQLLTNTYVMGRTLCRSITSTTNTTNPNPKILKFKKNYWRYSQEMDGCDSLDNSRPYFGHAHTLWTFCQLLDEEKLHSINSGSLLSTNPRARGRRHIWRISYEDANFRERPSLSQLWMIFNTLRLCFSWKIKSEGSRNV